MIKGMKSLAAIVFVGLSVSGCATFNCEEKAKDIARVFQNEEQFGTSSRISSGLPVPIRNEFYAWCVNRQLERLYGKKYKMVPNAFGSHTVYEFY